MDELYDHCTCSEMAQGWQGRLPRHDCEIAQEQRTNVLQRNRSELPIGIKTPLELVGGKSLFRMHTEIGEQIQDNLRNLLLTNWGERVALTNFGANLRPLLTEFTNKDDFDTEAMLRINTAISKWMPFVVPVAFESKPDLEDNNFTGKIRVFVVYSVTQLNIKEQVLEVDLFII